MKMPRKVLVAMLTALLAACGGGGSGGGGGATGGGSGNGNGGNGNGNGGDGSGGVLTVQSLPGVAFQSAAGTLASSGNSVIFTLARTGATTGPLVVSVNISATNSYVTSPPTTVSFTAGNDTATLTVPLASGRDKTLGSTVTATVTDGSTYTLGTQQTATAAVPALPKVALASVTVPGNSVIFSLTRTGATTGPLVVSVSVTATNGYVTSPPTTVTFEAGNDTATLTVPLASGRDATLGSSVTATVTTGSTYLLGTTYTVMATVNPVAQRTLAYQEDVFPLSGDFAHWCANPRLGTDSGGNPYPDLLGTNLHEKYWIRSFNDEWYLWYDEVEDVDPASVVSKTDYFQRLKTQALYASGTLKDQFRFTETTEAFERRRAGTGVGYGMTLAGWQSTSSGLVRYVLYTEPDSPAETAGLRRGTQIKSYPSGALSPTLGASHTFVVRGPGASEDRSVTMTAV